MTYIVYANIWTPCAKSQLHVTAAYKFIKNGFIIVYKNKNILTISKFGSPIWLISYSSLGIIFSKFYWFDLICCSRIFFACNN